MQASSPEECNEWIRSIRSAFSSFTAAEVSNSSSGMPAAAAGTGTGTGTSAAAVGIGFPMTLQPTTSSHGMNMNMVTTEKKLSQRLKDGFATPMLSGNGFWAHKTQPPGEDQYVCTECIYVYLYLYVCMYVCMCVSNLTKFLFKGL